MKVILVNEDNHGLLCVAKDYYSAFNFLFNGYWIEDYTEIYDGEDEEGYGIYVRVKEKLGENWVDDMATWDIKKFNDFWDGSFYLDEVEVVEFPTV